MNVKEIIWGNIKEVVEEIDEENRGKVEVMKLKEDIKPKGWKGKNLELKKWNIYSNRLLMFPIGILFKLITNLFWKGLTTS